MSRNETGDFLGFIIRNELSDPEKLPTDLSVFFDAFYPSV
ncbi:MAG: hypothetical protein ACJAVK_002663 [Akkermansiaceae bacterium]|jgi:hypothetical protein